MTSCCFLYIPPRAVLIKVSFLVGLYALLVDVGVSFSAHLLYISWVEALFEVLEVHYIEERAIGTPVGLSYAPTASSTAFNC